MGLLLTLARFDAMFSELIWPVNAVPLELALIENAAVELGREMCPPTYVV